jgi:predicted Na+-dependent transporter
MNRPHFRNLLAFAGRNGPLMLFVGVLIGLVAPPLAEAARPLLGLAVFVFTLGAFLKVDLVSFRRSLEPRAWTACMLAWTTFGVPAVMLGLIRLFRPEASLAQGMMLCMLSPPVGSAAAIAAMLGLSPPLSLLATVAATILSPFYLPSLASWFAGYQLDIDPVAMTERLLLIVGGACASATLLRRYSARFVSENPYAMTGIAVLGLILVAIGAMRGMRSYFIAHPQEVASCLVLAFAVNIGFQILGAALFAPAGRLRALTIGLVSGNRNVTLVWAAAGASLMGHQKVELYLAMSVFPIFMLPALTRWPVTLLLRADPLTTGAGPEPVVARKRA